MNLEQILEKSGRYDNLLDLVANVIYPLSFLDQEISYIIFKNADEKYGLFILGVGSEGYSSPNNIRLEFIEEKQGQIKSIIRGHTHSLGTAEKYGPRYVYQFSGGDLNIFANREVKYGFPNILVTPSKVLIYNPNGEILDLSDKLPNISEFKLKQILETYLTPEEISQISLKALMNSSYIDKKIGADKVYPGGLKLPNGKIIPLLTRLNPTEYIRLNS